MLGLKGVVCDMGEMLIEEHCRNPLRFCCGCSFFLLFLPRTDSTLEASSATTRAVEGGAWSGAATLLAFAAGERKSGRGKGVKGLGAAIGGTRLATATFSAVSVVTSAATTSLGSISAKIAFSTFTLGVGGGMMRSADFLAWERACSRLIRLRTRQGVTFLGRGSS